MRCVIVKIFGVLITVYVVMMMDSLYSEDSTGWPFCLVLKGFKWSDDWLDVVIVGIVTVAIAFVPAAWPLWVHVILWALAEVLQVGVIICVVRAGDRNMHLDQLLMPIVASVLVSLFAHFAIAPVVGVIANGKVARLVGTAPWVVFTLAVTTIVCYFSQKRKSAADLADPADTVEDVEKKRRKWTLWQVVAVILCVVIIFELLIPTLSGWRSLLDGSVFNKTSTTEDLDKADSDTEDDQWWIAFSKKIKDLLSKENDQAGASSEGSGEEVAGSKEDKKEVAEEITKEDSVREDSAAETDSTGDLDKADSDTEDDQWWIAFSKKIKDLLSKENDQAGASSEGSGEEVAGSKEDKKEVAEEITKEDSVREDSKKLKTSDLWYQINASDPQAKPGHFGPSPEIPDDIPNEDLGEYVWGLFKDVVFGSDEEGSPYPKPDPNVGVSFAFMDDSRSGKRRLDYTKSDDDTINIQGQIVYFCNTMDDSSEYEEFMNRVIMGVEQYNPEFEVFTGAEVKKLGLELRDQFYADFSKYDRRDGKCLELPVVWECGLPEDDDLFLRIRYYIKGQPVEEWLSIECLFQGCNASEVLKITPVANPIESPSSNTPPGGDPQSQSDDPSDDPPQSYHKNSTISTAWGRTNSNSGAGASWNNGVGATISAAEYNNPSSSSPTPPPSPDQIPTTTPSTPTSVVASLVKVPTPGQVTVDSDGAEAAKPVEDKPSVALSADGQPVAGTTAQGTFLVPGSG